MRYEFEEYSVRKFHVQKANINGIKNVFCRGKRHSSDGHVKGEIHAIVHRFFDVFLLRKKIPSTRLLVRNLYLMCAYCAVRRARGIPGIKNIPGGVII